MDAFDPAQATASSSVTKLLPALVGLLAAAAVAFSAASPPTHYLSWTGVLTFALQRLFAVSLASVLTVAILCAIVWRGKHLDSQLLLVQTSRAAIWLAPLALLIRANSAWTLVAVAAFAILLTPSLRLSAPRTLDPEDSVLLSLRPDILPLFPKLRPQMSVAAALCAQTGMLIFFAGYTTVGSILFGVAICAWAWWSIPGANSLHASQAQNVPAVLLATVFTLAALLPYLHGAVGFGLGSSHQRAVRVLPRGRASARRYTTETLNDSQRPPGEGNTGIVLWPEMKLHTQLIAPAPIDLTNPPALGPNANPLVIPFDGVYWFFKAPDVRPPTTSRQAHASPETVDIRSTDGRPLSIEAHDYLGSLIALDCCSRIQIAVRNADRYPDTISLELILVDTSQAGQPSESLGRMLVKSTRPWRIYERPQPVSEMLNFQIPPHASLRNFDEVRIIFRLDPTRAEAGARIAIDHLVLVPRGL
ncbi:MAG TPA: hypothetical protein VF123_20800 [Candidatus Sulfotelmatobacter sp.]